jgi:outer membrane protein insertion porin family
VATVSVSGNSAAGSREVLEWLSTRQGQELSHDVVQRDVRAIEENYRGLGYYGTRVDSVEYAFSADSSLVDLTFRLDEGKQSVIHRIFLSGNNFFDTDELLGKFLVEGGDPFIEAGLEADILAMLGAYERVGYPLATCEVEEVRRIAGEADSLDILLRITEGPVVTIDEISVEGNTETDRDVIVRETRIRTGELFDPAKSEAIRTRLQRLNIFSAVSEPELYLRDQSGGLLIKVQEGNSNTFDGIIGYVPAGSTGGEGFVTGLVAVTMRNLFGTGRKFSFRWQREDRFSQELGIRYLEPWVFGFPANLSAGFYQRQQDTTFVKRAIDPKAELMVTEEFSIAVFYVNENVIPRAGNQSDLVLKTNSQTIGGELIYDTRDDLFSATSGARYRTDYQFGKRRTSDIPAGLAGQIDAVAEIQKFSLDLDFYLTTFSRQVAAVGLHGREMRGDQIDEGQMYRFGGTTTMRGYRENQFLGTRVAWTNTEYRFIIGRRSYVYGFIDTGYYFRPEDTIRGIPPAEDFKYGYGFGLQVETGLGHLGVSYALGEGDTFSTGKDPLRADQ